MRFITSVVLIACTALCAVHRVAADEWRYYGRDPQGTRYSPLSQITPRNVTQLKLAWTYHTGDVADGRHGTGRSGFETTPLLIGGKLYLTTSFNRVIALDPAAGRELWAYDPKIDMRANYGEGLINRGVAAWQDPARRECALSLFEATVDARLIAIDGATGKPCAEFGNGGEISLRDVVNYRAGWYHMTSPPIVVNGIVIVGSAINDNARADMPDGAVRGFDARTGKLLWQWESLERPTSVPPQQWNSGAANAWSILSADPKRHLVYVPTGSASPDYYGGRRPGDNRWADSVVALDTRTGKLVWGFQLVHHDLWDYDTAAAPLITTILVNGRPAPVVIAGNKTGMLYVLDPASGKPVLPLEERAVPQSTLTGEVTAPTQPFPVALPPLVRQALTPQEAWGITDTDREACAREIGKMSSAQIFAPPSTAGFVAVPGNIGGINWSGFAWDAANRRLIVAVTNLAYKVRLIPRDKVNAGDHGSAGAEFGAQTGTPYAMVRELLLGPSGLPCTPPPWGELVAIDLGAGKIAWRSPLGTMSDLFPTAGAGRGSATLGGPIATAGGLIFIGGTMDRRLHAFSSATGKELWSTPLPASAHALPITYEAAGKQFVVIAAGGHSKVAEEEQSDALMAFALP